MIIQITIERATIHNFGINTKKSLAQAGIYSAADFTDINSDGYFKSRSGNWIKINGIGWSKANDLFQWRKTVEAAENLSILKKVKQSYSNRYTELNNLLTDLTSKFEIVIKPFKEDYEKQRMKNEGLNYLIMKAYERWKEIRKQKLYI